MRSEGRRRVFKTTILCAPFLVIFAALNVYGTYVREWRTGVQHGGPSQRETVGGVFEFYSDRPSGEIRIIGGYLERFEEELLKAYGAPLRLKKIDHKLKIHLYTNHDELEKFAQRTTMSHHLAYNGGFYNPVKEEIAIELSGDRRTDIAGAFHEVFHAILDISVPNAQWSPWFSEGLATYFEASDAIDDGRVGGLDRRRFGTVKRAIETGTFIPLRKLLTADPGAFASEENVLYYAEAHTLCWFLLEATGGSHRQDFFAYYDKESSPGPCSVVAFESIFGDLSLLEKEFTDFILPPR